MSARDLSDLAHDACKLAAMLEGLDVLIDQSTGADYDPMAKMARNALPPMIETLIQKAWQLNLDLEMAEMGERKK